MSKPAIGSKWYYKFDDSLAYVVERYVDEDNLICSYDNGTGKTYSTPFLWVVLRDCYRSEQQFIEQKVAGFKKRNESHLRLVEVES